MLTIPDFHGQNAPKEELEEVVLLPDGFTTDAVINLPSPLDEFIEIGFLHGQAANVPRNGEQIFSKEDLETGATVTLNSSTANTSVSVGITVTDQSTLSVGYTGGSGLLRIVGYKKRYATKNLSRTVAVNGGNNITVNSRYEVELPSEFYEADGSIKKGVQVRAEIFNNSGTGVAEWGETGNYTDSSSRRFAKASVVADKVIVQTGQTGIAAVSSQGGSGLGLTTNITSAPCQVIATLNDAYILSVEPAQGSFERIVNAGLDVIAFTNNGDYAYMPLSDTDFDGDIFEYNSTTRFLRPKKSGKHIPSVFSHAEDGAGQARVKYVLVQADTAQGDNPVVVSGVFTKQYTNDGGTQSIHTPINLDESKWYALYAENFTSGNVTYTSLVSPTSEPDLGDITDYAFIFSLERG